MCDFRSAFSQETIDVAILIAVCLVHTVSVETFICVYHIQYCRFTNPDFNWTPLIHFTLMKIFGVVWAIIIWCSLRSLILLLYRTLLSEYLNIFNNL